MKTLFPAALFASFTLWAAGLSARVIDIGNSGWLSQYSLNTETSSLGDVACVPTATVNALVQLQNLYPTVYGDSLAGSTYSAWLNTAFTLADRMGTTSAGTYDDAFIQGVHDYIKIEMGFSHTSFSAMINASEWVDHPQPSYSMNGTPTITFLQDALASNQSLLIGFTYTDFDSGHMISVNGLQWDATSGSGTLYFVDPLDPSENYDDDFVTGIARQSTADISVGSDGLLRIDYDQYWGSLPYAAEYGRVSANITVALAFGLIPEPAAFALIAGFCSLALATQRRRRRTTSPAFATS